MKRILIYDSVISGHHMEYLHHIYMAVNNVDAEFVFVIPEDFLKVKDKLQWPERKNITFDFIPQTVLSNLKAGWFASRWKHARLSANYIRKHIVDEVFFVELIIQFPFLPFFIPKSVKVSGIIYQLMPYEWPRLSCLSKVKCILEVGSYAKSTCVKAPMMLNDPSCASYYNRCFHTDKFIPIVDPVMQLNYNPRDVRKEFGITEGDKMILQFGAMNYRKGTMLLLEAVCRMDTNQLKDKVFVFAGKIGSDIRESFYELKDALVASGARIYVFDEFCTYERLADLCRSTDCIVVPYHNYSYSSGVIGYSAQFHKTIIGPCQGILGKLIRRNRLGLTFSNLSPDSIANILCMPQCYSARENSYYERNSVASFVTTIITTVLQ